MPKFIFNFLSRSGSTLGGPQNYMQYLAKVNKEIEAWTRTDHNH